jgi:2'-5' RNA ligase
VPLPHQGGAQRLFIACDISPPVRSQIAAEIAVLRDIQADVRWEPAEKLHLTLKFLGETPESLITPIGTILESIARPVVPFELIFAGMGCFPDGRQPRVIWIGTQDASGALPSLSRGIDEAMVSFGFKRETRPFAAHLTVGRVKGPRGISRLLRTMETVTFRSDSVTVQEILLVRSQLGAGGSVYTTLQRFPLGGASNR